MKYIFLFLALLLLYNCGDVNLKDIQISDWATYKVLKKYPVERGTTKFMVDSFSMRQEKEFVKVAMHYNIDVWAGFFLVNKSGTKYANIPFNLLNPEFYKYLEINKKYEDENIKVDLLKKEDVQTVKGFYRDCYYVHVVSKKTDGSGIDWELYPHYNSKIPSVGWAKAKIYLRNVEAIGIRMDVELNLELTDFFEKL